MRDPEKWRKTLNLAGDLWMEARYGWRPFIYDVIGHVEAFTSPNWSERRTVRKSKMYPASEWQSLQVLATASGGLGDLVRRQHLKFESKLRCGQTADYRSSVDLTALRYGLYDVVGTAWELVPYSFVVDWFVNIGDMARALQAYAFIHERIGFATVETTFTNRCECYIDGAIWVPASKGYREWVLPPVQPSCTEYGTIKERTVPTSFLPSFDLKFNVDWAKAIDLALILKNLTHPR
jgi:hypothetical protein